MRYFSVLLLILGLFMSAHAEDNLIVELNVDTYDSFIETNEDVIMKIYTPWCEYCQRFEPVYKETVEELRTMFPNVKAVQVDVSSNPRIGRKLNIRGFPALFYFKSGKPYLYSNRMKKDNIIEFVKQYAGASKATIGEVDLEHRVNNVKRAISLREYCVLGFFEDDQDLRIKELDQALYMVENTSRILIKEKDVAEKLGFSMSSIVFYEGLDKHYRYQGEMIRSEIRKWIFVHQLPLIVPYNPENTARIFNEETGVDLRMLFFTYATPTTWSTRVTEMVERVAESYRGKLIVIGMSAENKRLLGYYGVTKADVPAILLTDKRNGKSMKYRMTGMITEDRIRQFVEQGLAGTLIPYLRSQPEPPPSLSPVKKLVGSTITRTIRESSKHIFVFFYTEFDNNSSDFEPIFESIAQSMVSDNSIMFASFNTMENEVEWFTYKEFPIVLSFKPGMVESYERYRGMWEEEPFKEFVQQQVGREEGEEEL